MDKKTVFLYSNQPVIRFGKDYFSKYKSFLDFLTCLAEMGDYYKLVVPCKEVKKYSAVSGLYPIEFYKKPMEVYTYNNEAFGPIISVINALKLLIRVKTALGTGNVVVCGPGPNSLLVYLSLIAPNSVSYGFIIRGDTLKTVEAVYEGSWICFAATTLVKLFRKRIVHLLIKRKAIVFLIGGHLKDQYSSLSDRVIEIFPLIVDEFMREDKRPKIPENGPLRFLFVGRLSREKNIFELLRAIEICSNWQNRWKLTIAGTGPLESEVSNRALNLINRVKLTGHIADVKKLITLYDSNDILCLPSLTEGTPGTVIEAFARGMPVLATPVGSLPLHLNKEIRFISGYTAERIIEGMRWCDNNRSKISKMGQAGRQKIKRFLIRDNAMLVDRLIMSFLESTKPK
jgi:glycosyltransferase involved in cell wall biosynthesis